MRDGSCNHRHALVSRRALISLSLSQKRTYHMIHPKQSEFSAPKSVLSFPDPRGYPTKEELDAFFTYDAETGKLYNRVTRGRAKAGNEAGSLNDTGSGRLYRRIVFNGAKLYAHTAIYIMHTGGIPVNHEIDHIDQDRLNNRLENLRSVTHSDNSKNFPLYSRNTSGVMGVRRERNKWRSQIRVGGRDINLGLFAKKSEAAEARKKADRLYGYHENHGLRHSVAQAH